MTFREAQYRLLADLRHRIHNGDLTERGLARLTGISQPHVHNVLKGIRFLSIGSLDLTLKCLNYSLLDVFSPEELEAHLTRQQRRQHIVDLPILESPLGPGAPWLPQTAARRKFSLPSNLEHLPEHLVLAHLKFDPRMAPNLTGLDLVALDISLRFRASLVPDNLYVISTGGDAVLRHVRHGARCIYLVTAGNLDHPAGWEPVQVSPQNIPDVVRAMVVWIGRETDLPPLRHQRGRLRGDATSW